MIEIANIGKMVSTFFIVLLYFCMWGWTLDHAKDCNRNAIWEVLAARGFIALHIISLIVWFIWSWTN